MKPRKLKSGTWFIQTQVNGTRKSFSAPTRAEVIRKATEYKLTASDAPSAPLGVLIDRYIDMKRNILSPSTIKRYELTRRSELQRLMTIPARDLTADRIQAEINIMAVDHSPKTVRNAYGLINATLSLFAPELHFRVTMPPRKQIDYSVPTTDEIFALINAASDHLKTAIMLAAFCGLRRGEIAALEMTDIKKNTKLEIKDIPVGTYTVTELEDGREIDSYSIDISASTTSGLVGLVNAYTQDKGNLEVTKKLEGAPAGTDGKEFKVTITNSEGKYLKSDGIFSDEEVVLTISKNVIHVKSAAVYDADRRQINKSPKTFTSDRYVPAPQILLDHIKGTRGRVCPLSLNSITHRFAELRTRLGLTCRFHDLRHYYASALHAVGVRDQYIMKFGGWSSDGVLKSIYRGTLDDFEAAAAEQAINYFDQTANKMLTNDR